MRVDELFDLMMEEFPELNMQFIESRIAYKALSRAASAAWRKAHKRRNQTPYQAEHRFGLRRRPPFITAERRAIIMGKLEKAAMECEQLYALLKARGLIDGEKKKMQKMR